MMPKTLSSRSLVAGIALAAALSLVQSASAQFFVHNLVSDGFVPAAHNDPLLRNPWGLAAGPSTPWWVADTDTNVSTIYNGLGAPRPLVVSIPPPPVSLPTGVVFNGGPGFVALNGGVGGPSRFIFATITGFIVGWNPTAALTNGVILANRSLFGAHYTGLGIGRVGGHDFIYGANFGQAQVDVFDENMNFVGSFGDSDYVGYAPFNVQAVGDRLIVTFALIGPDGHDLAGPGNGFVDVFDMQGHLLKRLIAHGALNSPWGVALAPKEWGRYSRALLIGNFGDGTINGFGHDGHYIGTLSGLAHKPIVLDGLWALRFGLGGRDANGVSLNGNPRELYFTAGLNDEADGLFGKITLGAHGDNEH